MFAVVGSPCVPAVRAKDQVFRVVPNVLLCVPSGKYLPVLFAQGEFPIRYLLLVSVPLVVDEQEYVTGLRVVRSVRRVGSCAVS